MADYLKIPEVARRLDLSEKTVRRYIKAGEIPAVYLGSTYRVSVADLVEYMRGAEVRPASGKVKASDLDRLPPMARRTLQRLLRAKEDKDIYWDVQDILGMREEFQRLGISNEAFVDWLEQATLADLDAPAPEEEPRRRATPGQTARALMSK